MTIAQSTDDLVHGELATARQSGLAVVDDRQAPKRGLAVAHWDEFYFDAARSARDRARDARRIGNDARARTAFSDAYRYLRWARGLGYVR